MMLKHLPTVVALLALAASLQGCAQIQALLGGSDCDTLEIGNGKIEAGSRDTEAVITCNEGFEFTGTAPKCGWVNKVCVKAAAAAAEAARRLEEAAPAGEAAKEEEEPAEPAEPECANEYGWTSADPLTEWPEGQAVEEVDTPEELPDHGLLKDFKAKANELKDKASAGASALKDKATAKVNEMKGRRLEGGLPPLVTAESITCTKSADEPAAEEGEKPAEAEASRLYQSGKGVGAAAVSSFLPGLFIGAFIIGGAAFLFRKFRTRRVQVDDLDEECNNEGLE